MQMEEIWDLSDESDEEAPLEGGCNTTNAITSPLGQLLFFFSFSTGSRFLRSQTQH